MEYYEILNALWLRNRGTSDGLKLREHNISQGVNVDYLALNHMVGIGHVSRMA